MNDGRIQNPSKPFGIVPLSNFVPRGFGVFHHSIAILYHEVPNPNLTIRNFFIAVQRTEELERKLAAELEALDSLHAELKDREASVKTRETYKVLLESNLSWLRSRAELVRLEASLESQKHALAGLGATAAVVRPRNSPSR